MSTEREKAGREVNFQRGSHGTSQSPQLFLNLLNP